MAEQNRELTTEEKVIGLLNEYYSEDKGNKVSTFALSFIGLKLGQIIKEDSENIRMQYEELLNNERNINAKLQAENAELQTYKVMMEEMTNGNGADR